MESTAIAGAAMALSQGKVGAAAAQQMMQFNQQSEQAIAALIESSAANLQAIAVESAGSATAPGVGTTLDRQV